MGAGSPFLRDFPSRQHRAWHLGTIQSPALCHATRVGGEEPGRYGRAITVTVQRLCLPNANLRHGAVAASGTAPTAAGAERVGSGHGEPP